jgi:hypothetical protein
MALKEQIDKIEKVEKSTKAVQIEVTDELQRASPNKERFDNLMTIEKSEKIEKQSQLDPATQRNSLFDEARSVNSKTDNLKITPPELVAQTEQVVKNSKGGP